MSNSERGGFWRVTAKLSQQRDQLAALIRDEYLQLDEEDQRLFREWVDTLASVTKFPTGRAVSPSVKIHLYVPSVAGDDGSERVAVSPATLAAATAAWQRGDRFIPDRLEF